MYIDIYPDTSIYMCNRGDTAGAAMAAGASADVG